MAQNDQAHDEIFSNVVKHFLALKLTYHFTASLIDTNLSIPTIRFQFSKPTKEAPVPAITVTADVRLVEHDGTTYTYTLLAEGQRFERLITLDEANVTGKEFNEQFLDKVFMQKQQLQKKHLWYVS